MTTEITQAKHYRGLELNDTSKGKDGYYISHLENIYSSMAEATLNLANPLASHFVIDSPKAKAINSLSQELNRWKNERLNTSEAVRYFTCLETRPRSKQKHLHILVIYQKPINNEGFLSTSLNLLTERLSKLSKTNSATLCKRMTSARSMIIDPEFGVIKVNEEGSITRLGSPYYHNLATEFNDAFERFSYLAKVQTKAEKQIYGANWSKSRIKAPPKIENKINATAHTRTTDLHEQKTSLSICDSYTISLNQVRSTKAIGVRSCRVVRAITRPNRFSDLLQRSKNYSCFTKSSEDSENNYKFNRI